MQLDAVKERIVALQSCEVDELPRALSELSSECSSIEDVAKLGRLLSDFSFPKPRSHVSSVAMYYHRLANGGIERETVLLASLFLSMGYRVVVIVDAESANDYTLPNGVYKEALGVEGRLPLSSEVGLKRLERLSLILSEYDIDMFVNHAWLMANMIYDALLCRMRGVRYIVNTHGVFSFPLVSSHFDGSYFSTYPRLLALCNGVVTQTNASGAFFKHFCQNVYVIPNCVDLNLETSLENQHERAGEKTILWVGRFDEYKQPLDAIEILDLVKRNGLESARLVFVGASESGAFEKHLQAYAKELAVEDSVVLEGFQSDVDRYYAEADIMLMTTAIEGFSMVLLEASAMGLPTVMYRLPYLPFADSEGVVEVDMGDVDAAAREVVRIIGDESIWQRMSAGARKCFRGFLEYDYDRAWREVFSGADGFVSSADAESLMWDTLFDHYAMGLALSKKAVQWDIDRAREEVQAEYDNSVSYKLGRCLTALPRRLKKRER